MLSPVFAYLHLATRFSSERGASMVEYAIMVALIAITSLLVIGALGFNVFTVFDTAQETIGPALSHCDHPHAIHSPVHC